RQPHPGAHARGQRLAVADLRHRQRRCGWRPAGVLRPAQPRHRSGARALGRTPLSGHPHARCPRTAGGVLRPGERRPERDEQRRPGSRRGRGRVDQDAARPATGRRPHGLRCAVARTHARPPAPVLLLGPGPVLAARQHKGRSGTGAALSRAARRALERLAMASRSPRTDTAAVDGRAPLPLFVRIPPPLTFAAAFALGTALQHVAGLPLPAGGWWVAMHVAGGVLANAGLLLALVCLGLFARKRTTVLPSRSASAIVARGP